MRLNLPGRGATLSAVDEILSRFDRQVRRQPRWPGVEHADRVIRLFSGGWTGVLWSDLDAASADAVIAREIERFAGAGEWEWKHYSYDQPHDLAFGGLIDRQGRPKPAMAQLAAIRKQHLL